MLTGSRVGLVAINNWWAADTSESFWMEITDRDDLGESLWAPQRDASGKESWSYSLVNYVQPGDKIYHWHSDRAGEPAIVGSSIAVGPWSVEQRSWQAHGTRGRARGVPTVGPAWVMPLQGFVELEKPVTRKHLNSMYAEVAQVLEDVALEAGGRSYAPFQRYGGREIRAQQAYLTKFPRALLELVLGSNRDALANMQTESIPARSPSQGYLRDGEARSAIERHAVRLVKRHYLDMGAVRIEERGKPFDLLIELAGVERHVEVNGSTGADIATVQLTQGEVLHAERFGVTDLVVVDEIKCWRDQHGEIRTDGGRVRVWREWIPLARNLTPTHLRYELPS